jgi:hypothetical protein
MKNSRENHKEKGIVRDIEGIVRIINQRMTFEINWQNNFNLEE